MCGIVGYIGKQNSVPILVGGLRRLEYRGYDSAGVAVVSQNKLQVRRCQGKLSNLESLVTNEVLTGTPGIGHTRWATHGRPSDENAHPHFYKGVAVIHNGIIENYLTLKEELLEKGHVFASETDTEIFAHLISDELDSGKSLTDAVRTALGKVVGTYALAVLCDNDLSRIVAAKNASPLVIGLGTNENFIASDVPALLDHTRNVIFLEEGDFAEITADKVHITDNSGRPVNRVARHVEWTPLMAEKGGHKHFMHKEIAEQPRAVADTIRGRVLIEEGDVFLDGVDQSMLQGIKKVVLLACGTSYHAGLVGRQMIETFARVPVDTDLASEFRYRDLLVDKETLVIAISQSGETLDTIAALREAKSRGCPVISICNVLGSAIPRESKAAIYTHAGPEIGVASTKAFTTQLVALYLLAIRMARARNEMSPQDAQKHLQNLCHIPKLLEEVLRCEDSVKEIARAWQHTSDCLFLGRGPQYPVALEGALKLKEISYVHAEGYPAGEMKHGPIALIDPKLPVVVVATNGPGHSKIIGNISEVKARGGKVISICNQRDSEIARLSDHVIIVPETEPLLAPIITVIPTQLFAYHVADLRGTDVDQPRNLAKSVTVE